MASKRAVVAKIELIDQIMTGLQDLRRFEMKELEEIEAQENL